MTSTVRAVPASSDFTPCWNAAEPEAQAFSTRVAGVLARESETWRANEEAKPSGTIPELNWPR